MIIHTTHIGLRDIFKYIYITITAILILSSCTQDLPVGSQAVEQEVVFVSASEYKTDPFNCDNPNADYAKLTITQNGEPHDIIEVPVFYIDEVMFTQAIKLTPGSYQLTHMELFAEGAGEQGEDLLVNAVPYSDSEYGALVTTPLPADVVVSPFVKTEVPISILCYESESYLDFGFTWFRIDENRVRSKHFFGDFCTKFYKDYINSDLYAPKDIKVDMPAIFKLRLHSVLSETDSTASFISMTDNSSSFDNGKPITLAYPDLESAGDLFRSDIYIYVKIGDGFGFKSFGSWFWKDNSDTMYSSMDDLTKEKNGFIAGIDGVYDFILGNCNVDGADFTFAPYMNLPGSDHGSSIDMKISISSEDDRSSYLIASLTGIGEKSSGFDMWDGDFEVYCFDLYNGIKTITYYDISIYSTLYPEHLPSYMHNENWPAVNWLANNYSDFDGWTWEDLQQALWTLENNGYQYDPNGDEHGVTANLSIVDDMVARAIAKSINGYQPMPGGWAAVVLEAGETVQTIFAIVDP